MIALFATSNTCLMMLISGSRIIYGKSNIERKVESDPSLQLGSLPIFPKLLARVHKTRRTPWIAVIIIMMLVIITIILSGGSISKVASVSVFGIFIVYFHCQSFFDSIEIEKAPS
jgi:amino acid transporter